MADFRHRALRHHGEGVFVLEAVFGATLTTSTGRQVPVRLIGGQNVRGGFGNTSSFADWVRCIRPELRLGRVAALEEAPDPGG